MTFSPSIVSRKCPAAVAVEFAVSVGSTVSKSHDGFFSLKRTHDGHVSGVVEVEQRVVKMVRMDKETWLLGRMAGRQIRLGLDVAHC